MTNINSDRRTTKLKCWKKLVNVQDVKFKKIIVIRPGVIDLECKHIRVLTDTAFPDGLTVLGRYATDAGV